MKPEDLIGKTVDITGSAFKITHAIPLREEEWSLVGYWLDEGGEEPEVPFIKHIVIPEALISIGAA